ncbi:hypothetical protein [Ramlibacter albus]|uniref:Uncharacterized protein n=1 Tax=Ramlibacter albus TaxID=2079448 RepID=A0A923MB46_9BURK|nr:hypothetical protein [Ramlibacter albus]MBC5767577.1 hypothetical protein [Ramlibacter albus]
MSDPVGPISKVLELVRKLPLWLFAGVALACGILLKAVPAADLPTDARPWIVLCLVVSGSLATAKIVEWVVFAIKAVYARATAPPAIHLSPCPHWDFWTIGKDADGPTTQFRVGFLARNTSDQPIALVSAKLVRPRLGVTSHHIDVMVKNERTGMSGSARTGHLVTTEDLTEGTSHALLKGKPWFQKLEDPLVVVVEFTDDLGRKYRFKRNVRGVPRAKAKPARPPLEQLGQLAEPAKTVAAVLQAELSRYDLNGRQGGGLGSVHLVLDGRESKLGTDSWTSNSPKNQSLWLGDGSDEPAVVSDNADALVATYDKLEGRDDELPFFDALFDRMGGNYARVAYLVVLVALRVGQLERALEAAIEKLPDEDGDDHALSNIQMLLNGMLKFRHQDFGEEDLDAVESFVGRLKSPPTLRIRDKVASIRAIRAAH